MITTRRSILLGLAAGGMAVSAADGDDLIAIRRHAQLERLARLMIAEMMVIHGGEWKFEIDHAEKFVLMVPVE